MHLASLSFTLSVHPSSFVLSIVLLCSKKWKALINYDHLVFSHGQESAPGFVHPAMVLEELSKLRFQTNENLWKDAVVAVDVGDVTLVRLERKRGSCRRAIGIGLFPHVYSTLLSVVGLLVLDLGWWVPHVVFGTTGYNGLRIERGSCRHSLQTVSCRCHCPGGRWRVSNVTSGTRHVSANETSR